MELSELLQMNSCDLCHRHCHANRLAGQTGYCGMPAEIYAARAALHHWEEPCISGSRGSGAVFFSGCSLRCVFCQNHEIALGKNGIAVSPQRLAELFLMLQDEKKAHNINLITPTHYIPQIVSALNLAKNRGLTIPIVYNTGTYETLESIKMLDGLIDVYLPDLKYADSAISAKYANAPDYFSHACETIMEMYRQVGTPVFQITDSKTQITRTIDLSEAAREKLALSDLSEEGMMTKGMIIRHLLLPGCKEDSKRIIGFCHQTFGDNVFISIMNQYTPLTHVSQYSELNRKVTSKEYDDVVNFAIDLGMENAFIQDGETAQESFIPDFHGEGIL